MSTSGTTSVVEAVALQADLASSFASATVLEVSRNRRRWRVVAGPISEWPSEVVWHGGEDKIESFASALAQPRPQERSNSLEFVPARNNPDPIGFRGNFVSLGIGITLKEWPGETPAHEGLELHQDILVRLANLKAGLEPTLIGSVSGDTDISLAFEKTSAPRDFGIGRVSHNAIVPPPVAAHNEFTAILNSTMEV